VNQAVNGTVIPSRREEEQLVPNFDVEHPSDSSADVAYTVVQCHQKELAVLSTSQRAASLARNKTQERARE
jgi:hypothetical protein